MRSVHYFPRYSQRENTVTNNSLLLLVRLHQFSRVKFEDLIETICADDDVVFAPQWLGFKQQVLSQASVLDGFITQDSVKIAVETKVRGGFSTDQLERHLTIFQEEQHKLLLLLSPPMDANAKSSLADIRLRASKLGIGIVHVSFQRLIELVRKRLSNHDDEMLALIADFEAFCDESNLLPTHDFTMFVPPCGQSFLENEEYRLYYCPADRNRRNAKYLGIYAGLRVRAIGKISKIVACTLDLEAQSVTVLDGGAVLTTPERMRILGAAGQATKHSWNIVTGHRFYLCDEWASTKFVKTTPGGIQGHRYFDLRKELSGPIPDSLDELALALQEHTWQ